MTQEAILAGEEVTHELGRGELRQRILHGVSLSVHRGELTALTGASGSGKSTLLYLMGALDRPTGGRILYRGADLTAMNDEERATFRGDSLGYVFQFHFLLGEYTVRENVELPLLRQGKSKRAAGEAADEALALLGLMPQRDRLPTQLSGGQQQRVAIARAIAHKPHVILADEPTGSLDARNAAAVFAALKHLSRAYGTSVLVVTHDPSLAGVCDRRIGLADGRVVSQEQEHKTRSALVALESSPTLTNTGEVLLAALDEAVRADTDSVSLRVPPSKR